jgi:hypothetical protein
MTWHWKKGKATLATTPLSPASLSLTAGYSTSPEVIPRLDTTEAYRTLGVYISPSGLQKWQVQILWQYTMDYYTNVSSSSFTAEEALLSYTSYLRPRLSYPLPCTSLTQTQCRHIQVPALAALLPKMHLNRHTPHAVLFGPMKYGRLAMPDTYTDQGYGQLRFLIGHLHLADEVGDLIKIASSHLQVQVGSATQFFCLPYPPYSKWIEQTWLTSLWRYVSQLNIQIDIESAWVPPFCRVQDINLMDYAMTIN